MIEKQIIKANDVPIAIVLDYEEYVKMTDMLEDYMDREAAIRAKKETTTFSSRKELLSRIKAEENDKTGTY